MVLRPTNRGDPERIRSSIAAAKVCGKRLGRQPGQRPKSDRLALVIGGWLPPGRDEMELSKNTVADIVKRSQVR